MSFLSNCILSNSISFRILYCSTSSHYRSSFVRLLSCGRLRARGNRDHRRRRSGTSGRAHVLTQFVNRMDMTPSIGLGIIRIVASSDRVYETFSTLRSPRRFRRGGGSRADEPSQSAAGMTPGSLTANRAPDTTLSYSYSWQHTDSVFGIRDAVAIEMQPILAPIARFERRALKTHSPEASPLVTGNGASQPTAQSQIPLISVPISMPAAGH